MMTTSDRIMARKARRGVMVDAARDFEGSSAKAAGVDLKNYVNAALFEDDHENMSDIESQALADTTPV